LEIVWHTALSDAQYLKLNLLLRAEISSSTVHMPKYLQLLTRSLTNGESDWQRECVQMDNSLNTLWADGRETESYGQMQRN